MSRWSFSQVSIFLGFFIHATIPNVGGGGLNRNTIIRHAKNAITMMSTLIIYYVGNIFSFKELCTCVCNNEIAEASSCEPVWLCGDIAIMRRPVREYLCFFRCWTWDWLRLDVYLLR